MKNVFIFSGTKSLYDTVIESEIDELQKVCQLHIFREYNDIPKNKEKSVYTDIFSTKKFKWWFQTKIQDALLTKKRILNAYKKNNPTHLIIHSDWVLKEWQAIYWAKKKYNAIIIKRTPTAVFRPQEDYIWLKTRGSWFQRTASRILNQFILALFTTGKIHKTNLCWFPNNQQNYKKIKPNYDISLCYCEKTKKSLKSVFENSLVIKWPKAHDSTIGLLKPKKDCLLICSSDYEHIAAAKKINQSAAIPLCNLLTLDVIKNIIKSGYKCFCKFRKKSDLKSFLHYIGKTRSLHPFKSRLVFINPIADGYNISKPFFTIIGFTTSLLWKISLLDPNKRIIAYQFYPSPFYSVFKNYNGIIYVPFKNKNKIISNSVRKKNTIIKNKKLFTIADIISH